MKAIVFTLALLAPVVISAQAPMNGDVGGQVAFSVSDGRDQISLVSRAGGTRALPERALVAKQPDGNYAAPMPDGVIASLRDLGQVDLLVAFRAEIVSKSAGATQAVSEADLDQRRTVYAELKERVLATALAPGEFETLRDYDHLPLMYLRFRSEGALRRLLDRPDVLGASESRAHRKFLQQSLPLIGQPSVAAGGRRGAGTTVAVLDTGVDYTLAAFGSCASPGASGCKVVVAQDFAPSDGQRDDDGHGTNVAGIVLGVAPDSRIAALDVFALDGFAHDQDIADAANWSIANKVRYNIVALNLSLGSGEHSAPCGDVVAKALVTNVRSAGILPVAAAGNDGYLGAMAYPGCIPGVLSVGAVYDSNVGAKTFEGCSDSSTSTDQITCFSNSASFLTMLAPGSVISAAGSSYSGTSQAAPHVAGAVAVLRAAFPSEQLSRTVERLVGNAVQIVDPGNDLPKPRLSLSQATGAPAWGCPDRNLLIPGSASGVLRSNSCHAVSNSSGYVWYADVYEINGSAGQQITIDLTSESFDTWLGLEDPDGTLVVENDDRNTGTTNSRITHTLGRAGVWTILVESWEPHETGAYRVSIAAGGGGGGGGSSCSPTAQSLCLSGGRFRVTADWTKADRTSGHGTAISLTSDTGYFWFFSSTNIEVVTKVLNACAAPFNSFWVFSAGLTNVGVTLTYTDTKTGATKTYRNPVGSAFAPVQDTSAFSTCP